ncbi:MAG TPA: hypothetical protein DCL54_07050 [Alphaproteobacteria bacterium]|nr:hypothetical protein [Alphaproteobacteria bacterium]HAJ46321.1 hypothetical protein [Alphaproteobacteria bacterium]
MTAEILIMNKRAVAMAADSAVTTYVQGRPVVRNVGQKLFPLVQDRPVGVMVFGNAELSGRPWGHMVERFHGLRAKPDWASVEAAAADFGNSLDGVEDYFPDAVQRESYRMMLMAAYLAVHLSAAGPDEDPSAEQLTDSIDRVHGYLTKMKDLACFPGGFGSKILKQYADLIEDTEKRFFQEYKLGEPARAKLREIAALCVVKDAFLEGGIGMVTGAVFAGFGAKEQFPAMAAYQISGVVGGFAKRKLWQQARIEPLGSPLLVPYAQAHMAQAFIQGIDPDLKDYVVQLAASAMVFTGDQVVAEASDLADGRKGELRRSLREKHVVQASGLFFQRLQETIQQYYINPIMRVVGLSGEEELGGIARSLVELCAFRMRVAGEDQTVGGEVSAAVITRNGFTWSSTRAV